MSLQAFANQPVALRAGLGPDHATVLSSDVMCADELQLLASDEVVPFCDVVLRSSRHKLLSFIGELSQRGMMALVLRRASLAKNAFSP